MFKKSFKYLSVIGASAALAFGGFAVINDQDNNIDQTVQAAVKTSIKLPKSQGYTKSNILKANGNGRFTKSVRTKLVKSSMTGMIENNFSDDNPSDNRTVDVTHLSKSDKTEKGINNITIPN